MSAKGVTSQLPPLLLPGHLFSALLLDPSRKPSYSRLMTFTDCCLISTSVVFTAYQIRSVYFSSGRCITNAGSSIPVIPPFTATENASNPSFDFRAIAGSSFVDYVGFSHCGAVASVANVSGLSTSTYTPAQSGSTLETPSALGLTKTETLLATSSAVVTSTGKSSTDPSSPTSSNAPAASGPKTSLSVGAKIALGVVVSVFLSTVSALAIRWILRHRKRKLENRSNEAGTLSDEGQPYLQQKGELEAEEKRKYELQAEERRYELADDNQTHEMAATDSPHEMSTQRTQELRGEEHSQELDCGTE